MTNYLEKMFEKRISKIKAVEKVDLEANNHLSGKKYKYLKLSFKLINDLLFVRNSIKSRVDKIKK
jgi:DNA polymerase epsilon subunit 1